MNIEYIEDFIKVAEYQSLNQASKILNISTPAQIGRASCRERV